QGGEYGTALRAASLAGHIETVRLLLEHSADVNIIGGKYGTALQTASLTGHIDTVRLLLEHSADVNKESACCLFL
ncbi:ankyrin repeat-containing domain protein, partial [Mycena olivaceomarginata]